MKKLTIIFLFIPMLLVAQTTEVGKMKLNLTIGLEVSEICSMNWGKIIATADGVVTLNEYGRTATGKVTLPESDYALNNFNIKGGYNATVGLTLPQSASVTNGVTTLQVVNFTSNAVGNVFALSGTGDFVLKVGASVIIPSVFQSGAYNGQYSFVINYN